MRQVIQRSFGGPEVLEIVEAETPRPLATEVLVRTEAIGLNPIEARIRSGEFPLIGPPPFVLGWDVSGVVEESISWRFQPGDEVFGMPWFPRAANAYAEKLTVPALQLVRKPPAIGHVEAAALPIVGLTAWQALVDIARVQPGDRVLVHGAGGGVGHVAVQIAKALGAHVIATASAGKREFVESLGADEVIDYGSVDFVEVLRDLDTVFDTVGGDAVIRSVDVLRRGGHLVTAVAEDDEDVLRRAAEAGVRVDGVAVVPDAVALGGLVDLVERGRLRVHVQETFPLDRVVDAHRMLDAGHLQGKLVLVP